MTLSVIDTRDGFSFSGATTDQGPFQLLGGTYSFSLIDTGTADATLEMLLPDGSTFGALHAAYTTTTVGAIFQLPPGQVKVTVGTGTSLSAALIRVPTHRY